MDILPYGVGIATGTVGPCDMSAFQVFNVKVIISDSSGSDKRNFTPFQKGFVATSAGSDNQGIGIMYVVGADGYSGFVNHIGGDLGDSLSDKWDFVVNNYFHDAKLMSFYYRIIADSKKFV